MPFFLEAPTSRNFRLIPTYMLGILEKLLFVYYKGINDKIYKRINDECLKTSVIRNSL